MRISSLRLQLLAWVVLPLAALATVNLWTSQRNALATADLVTDRMLVGSARAIAEQVTMAEGVLDATVPPAAIEMFDTGDRDSVYYRVETAGGRLLTGYPDLPTASGDASIEAPYRDQLLRLATFSHAVIGAGPDSPIRVTVGVTLAGHDAMAKRLWLSAFAQQLALVAIAGVFVLLGLRRGLAPLIRLRDAVRSPNRSDLDPVEVRGAQSEIRPLIEALNAYMERVRAQMAAQRRFIANAAHQLRTPLALLSTQTSYALRETAADRRQEALVALQASSGRLARLAEQLLTLSRAEPGSRRPRADRIDLTEAARQVLETQAPTAITRNIDLGLEETGPVAVIGDGTMLREMIVNLVDNALRYTPAGGSVTVKLAVSDREGLLTVTDTGPGIPAEEREHVFERFYRVAGSSEEGSGLGLAIVREVVEHAGGSVALGDAAAGGLKVEVRLPLAAPDETPGGAVKSPAR
ncbi:MULTISPECIES: sensor histidine kinase [unclassified Mesorhizobium]|uniref:sensor histidine kinase n=1 Tax=unclassified Mesorhizobium TaxID=325217 RepID=UPI000BAEBA51|nr:MULTISPECIES: sensor histidine kinase [unclassified Mesorhizobium]TGT61136.1 sensor histidine kinase [Mesorhizobium sp. M00.F.Ca.ET.170.01.1.1]AZO08905.1 sensor histidine kinase [Mesorhizobium sp. M3A.F.Ca.ET.080.04.2.1]PBB84230.1 sensor histidine kinase [Mesorhizobium sp. WSM3876]RWB68131.1 MAG: sensor histidine kinase [Mesorhizobium sp.]RWB84626.1 MAG: sensor histidine kinase [Mesorhizobium sp.]